MQKKEKKIIDYFSVLKKRGLLSSSYLFVGDNLSLVFDIAKLVTCADDYFCDACDDCLKINLKSHPDLFLIDPEAGTIKIDQIRESRKFLSLTSYQAKTKVLIINYAHRLTQEASNAFLKTLEEPPPNCFIALISLRTDLLLPTIASRCRKIYLGAFKQPESSYQQELINVFEGKDIFISDRVQFSAFLLRLVYLLRDYIIFKIYHDTNRLINKANYEIIAHLFYSLDEAKLRLQKLLAIYKAIDNINLNLAFNLIRLSLG